MAKHHLAGLSVLGFIVAVVPVACWLDGPGAYGTFSGSLSAACGATPGVSMAPAYPAVAASGAASVVLGGSVTGGCPAFGVTLMGAFSASPMNSGYANWTAIVPLQAFLGRPCNEGSAANASTYAVDTQVLVIDDAGANLWEGVTPTPCVALADTAPACATPEVQAKNVYPAPASSGATSVVISGTSTNPQCAIASLSLLGAYPATPTGTNFSTWTATVPLASLQESNACSVPGTEASVGFAVPAEVVVAGSTGLGELIPLDAGCVGLSLDPSTVCEPLPVVTATNLSLDGSVAELGGTISAGACVVAGLQLFGVYPASSVGSSFLNWTAQVPAAVASATPCTAAGKVSISGSVIVPGSDGLPVAEPVDAGCVSLPGP